MSANHSGIDIDDKEATFLDLEHVRDNYGTERRLDALSKQWSLTEGSAEVQ